MLTQEQEKWIAHLSDSEIIKIVPFDQTSNQKFLKIKRKIRNYLGNDLKIEHHGATSLGISGQDEIDVYIPSAPDKFDLLVFKLTLIFGKPRSLYSLERARFVTEENGKHIDIFLINKESDNWKNLIKFENVLKADSEKLNKYRILKEKGNGLSVREYYCRKLEFMNKILSE